MDNSELIFHTIGTHLTPTTKLVLISMAVQGKAVTIYNLMDSLNVGRKTIQRAIEYPISKGWVVKTKEWSRAPHNKCLYRLEPTELEKAFVNGRDYRTEMQTLP